MYWEYEKRKRGLGWGGQSRKKGSELNMLGMGFGIKNIGVNQEVRMGEGGVRLGEGCDRHVR